MRSIGLDVHRDFCEVAILEQGVFVARGRVDTTPEALEVFAASLVIDDQVASNREEPGPGRSLIALPEARILPSLEQHLLDNVFG